MRRLRLRILLFVAALLAVGVLFVVGVVRAGKGNVGYEPTSPPPSHPELEARFEVVPDSRPAFTFDPAQPWQIDLGRGSGLDGLDTVSLASDGSAVLHRAKWIRDLSGISQTWKTAALTLPPGAVQRIAEAVNAEHLLDLGREYNANVFDGTQWVLWIRQGGREKVVYFDNHFPEPVVKFAAAVDAELVAVGDAVRWRGVPIWDHGRHDDDLWNATQR